MKKKLKCIMSVLLLTLLTITAMPNVATAQSSNKTDQDSINQITESSQVEITEVVDEITLVKKIKSYTEDELYELGCTEDEVKYIKNYDYNKVLADLSKKDTKVLEKMGYSNYQIKKLKEYDGTIDAIDYLQSYSLSNATLTLSFRPNFCNTKSFYFNYNWLWSSPPIFQGTDIIAFTWVACTSSSSYISMKYDSTPWAYVHYYFEDNDTYFTSFTVNPTYAIGNCSLNIDMKKEVLDADFYPKIGEGYIELSTQSGSSNLYSIQILGAYGHSTITLFPSVSFDTSGVSLGISFAWTMEELSRGIRTYKYDGTVLN